MIIIVGLAGVFGGAVAGALLMAMATAAGRADRCRACLHELLKTDRDGG